MAKFEKGKVFEQRGLVNYVDGGVVSSLSTMWRAV